MSTFFIEMFWYTSALNNGPKAKEDCWFAKQELSVPESKSLYCTYAYSDKQLYKNDFYLKLFFKLLFKFVVFISA